MSAEDSGRRGSGPRDRFHDDRETRTGRRSGTGRGRSDEAAPADGENRRAEKAPDDPEQFARDAVYRLLAARARSRSELMQALLRKGVEEDVAAGVLQKFDDVGLIDDAAFAESWVRQRHEHQGLGRRALSAELRRKGVDDQSVADALSSVDDDAEAQRARELVRRKLRGMRSVDPTTRTRRLVAMLARKGYGEGMAFRVVREEIEESAADHSDMDEADVDDVGMEQSGMDGPGPDGGNV